MDIPSFATRRLVLRPLCLADADAIQRVFPRWDVVRFLADRVPWPYPENGALTFVRDVALPAMAHGKAWHWSIRTQAEPERLIGVISLMDEPGQNRGFWLVPEWQGQGLMTEASEAVTAYWFETLHRPLLTVPKAFPNEASRRLSERSGMRRVAIEERSYVSGRLPTEIWEITREEWLGRKTLRAWSAMADVFVDNEVDYRDVARRLSGFDRRELKMLFFGDVVPVCAANLMSAVPPVWAGFDESVLADRITQKREAVARSPWRRLRHRACVHYGRWRFMGEWRRIEAALDGIESRQH